MEVLSLSVTLAELKSSLRYIEDFVKSRFVKSRFHCTYNFHLQMKAMVFFVSQFQVLILYFSTSFHDGQYCKNKLNKTILDITIKVISNKYLLKKVKSFLSSWSVNRTI